MNSNTFFRSPREWVLVVVNHLEQRLALKVDTVYRRQAVELANTTISYHIGEAEPVNEYANDGRHLHDIELRFLVEVPISMDGFDLEALDASTRVERELLHERFGAPSDLDCAMVVSNLPSKFDPQNGVFARTVTMKQRIRLGPVEESWHYIDGGCDHASQAYKTCERIGEEGS
ncbi:hypothetical protein [Vibrio splendidus]|uniref:hypothetical protein n=1 Tax=Vibrio splendidus TaxID=29497 RepID=UPI0026D7D22D